jgi:hypothetical protein
VGKVPYFNQKFCLFEVWFVNETKKSRAIVRSSSNFLGKKMCPCKNNVQNFKRMKCAKFYATEFCHKPF